MKKIIYCFLLSCTGIYATCNKRIDCSQTIYSFEGSYRAYPDLDSIHVNDTVWLESAIPTRLNDLFRNQMKDYSDAVNLGMAIGYGELTGGNLLDPGGIPAANSFENILIKGLSVQSIKPDQVRDFLFKEEGGMYYFKLGIVPKKKGLFLISPGNAAHVYTSRNKCDKADFHITFKNTDQHLYLYEQNRPGYILSQYDLAHLYCFKVY